MKSPILETNLLERSEAIASALPKEVADAMSEEDIRHQTNRAWDRFIEDADLKIRGRHEYSLAGGRIDSRYGAVVMEYKAPHAFRGRNDSAPARDAIAQLKTRFEDLESHESVDKSRIFGLGFDGDHFIFVRHWNSYRISTAVSISPEAVERVLRALISVGARGKSFTPEQLAQDFGAGNPLANSGVQHLYDAVTNMTNTRAIMLFAQWKIFFSEVCGYDVNKPSPKIRKLGEHYGVADIRNPAALLFAIHSYYALFMKFLAAEIVALFSPLGTSVLRRCVDAPSVTALKQELRRLEDGGIWSELGISNFLEGDLFSWYVSEWTDDISSVVRGVAAALDEYDPATLTVDPDQNRDLLKELYQELFPKQLLHDLGEYYTPDWLARYVIAHTGFSGDPRRRVLDPACGSGTFLVETINRIMKWFRQNRTEAGIGEVELLNLIQQNVIGFDLNPLAVLAARTNYLLAIRRLLRFASAVDVPVYLCDSIAVPSEYGGLFSSSELGTARRLVTAVGDLLIPTEVSSTRAEVSDFADVLEHCVSHDYTFEEFIQALEDRGLPTANRMVHESLYADLIRLAGEGRNGIWARIVKNQFAPVFTEPVDYIVGNPPWINWNNLPQQYREVTEPLWKRYGLWPDYLMGASFDFSQLFVYLCADAYLREGGRLGFVITQSVFKTFGGDRFRSFHLGAGGLRLSVLQVDDMVALQPFKRATNRTAVIILEKGEETTFPVSYYRWRRGEPRSEGWRRTRRGLRREEVAVPAGEDRSLPWLSGTQDEVEALSKVAGSNARQSHMGIHTYGGNSVFFVRALNERDSEILIENVIKGSRRKAKKVDAQRVEREFVKPLLRGRDVRPFLAEPSLRIVFPYTESGDLLSEGELKRHPDVYRYLCTFKEFLATRSQVRRAKSSKWYELFAVYDATFLPHKVLWREQSAVLTSAVVSYEHELVVPDHKLNFIGCHTADEAHFLCALLNASPVRLFVHNSSIPVQISTKALGNVEIPSFDSNNSVHRELVDLSREAHATARSEGDVSLIRHQIDRVSATMWDLTEEDVRMVQQGLLEFTTDVAIAD